MEDAEKLRLYKECILIGNGELLKYLKREYSDSLERLVNSADDDFKVMQGESRKLREIIALIEGAKASSEQVQKRIARKLERKSSIPNR